MNFEYGLTRSLSLLGRITVIASCLGGKASPLRDTTIFVVGQPTFYLDYRYNAADEITTNTIGAKVLVYLRKRCRFMIAERQRAIRFASVKAHHGAIVVGFQSYARIPDSSIAQLRVVRVFC